MGRISKARDRLGRVVAVKQLLHSSPHSIALFEREARITAQLQHPSMVIEARRHDAQLARRDARRRLFAARPPRRARLRAIEWREVENAALTPNGFTLRDVPRHLDRTGDPGAKLRAHPGSAEQAARRLDDIAE